MRNPGSIRPYQHVLEPLSAYLMIAMKQYQDISLQGSYNVGPNEDSCVCTEKLVGTFCKIWNEYVNDNLQYECTKTDGPHEANFLRLDCSKIKSVLEWTPRWDYIGMLEKTAIWTEAYLRKGDIVGEMKRQIQEYYCLNSEGN